MFKLILLVGAGGFIGSVGRYLVQLLFCKNTLSVFPYNTIIVNILGSLLIGIIYALSEKQNIMTPEWRIFLATGICGGFTTFSAFSYENISLLRDGQLMQALVYSSLSIIFGLLATYIGIILVKQLF